VQAPRAGSRESVQEMYAFFGAACRSCGLAIALLLLAANVALGRAVDRKRRVVAKLESVSTL